MTLTADLQARLSGLGVPVLAPDEVEVPARYSAATDAQGRPSADGVRGLAAYLAAHPSGYVQVEEPQGISAEGNFETYWLTLGCVAASPAACSALARAVTVALCGDPTRDPGAYRMALPGQPGVLERGAFIARPTFEISLFNGELAG